MAHPKRKTSKSVSRKRRTHQKLTPIALVDCPNCSEAVRPHHVCPACGHYRGQQVVDTLEV